MVSVSDQLRHYVSAQEVASVRPREERFIAEIRQLSTDWVARMCSYLNWSLEHDELVPNLQEATIAALSPGTIRDDLLRLYRERGDLFLFEDQLLGVIRAAILSGTEDSGGITDAQRSAFFWALFRYGDLHSAELGEVTDQDSAARMELRGLGVAQNSPYGNVLARAYALWLDLPGRAECAASPYAMDVAAEFAHATGATLAEYFAVAMTVMAHARDVGVLSPSEALPKWPLEPKSRFASSQCADRLQAALDALSGDRDEMRRLFVDVMPPDPRFLGVAMAPFRDRPLYRMRSGRYVLVSEGLLLDGVYDLAYWRVADHVREAHGGSPAFLRFTQFFAELLERYVADLLRSVYDAGAKRVFVEAEAVPPKGAPDVTVFLEDRVLMFEVTKTQLRFFDTVLRGDLASFDADVARTATKAAQLRDAAAAFRSGAIRYAGHDADVDRSLPVERVVVLSQPVPRLEFLTDRLRSALVTARVEPDAPIVSVGELEEVLQEGDLTRVSTALASWGGDAELRNTSLHNYIYFRGLTVPLSQRAPLIRANAEALRTRVIAEMDFRPE
ncbi:MAG: hypothetical protein KGK34_01075 [Chloroflexota bacterium]|nr:hypothetical protein [Chloroflexota bacterium]